MQRLERHFRKLTRAAFEQHGFAYADILCQWPAIAGSDLGRISKPVRIRWPRRGASGKREGTLVVRVGGGRALEAQYASTRIIERINGFFGYQAISALKIVNDSGFFLDAGDEVEIDPASGPVPAMGKIESGIADPELKAALVALGRGISADKKRANR